MPSNLLNLPAYRVIQIENTDHDYHIDAETLTSLSSCPHCNSERLVGFGRREQMIKDLPMHGRRVAIYANTRRYRCQVCGKTFYEPLPDVDDKRLMMKRLVDWMGRQAIKRTFASIAEEVGVTESTVRSVFSDYINEQEKRVRFETPHWMGIDEIHLIRPRCVISNIANNTIVELLHNRNKETVAKYLSKLDGKETVRFVSIDMWNPYREAINAVLPGATVIVDKFHVLKMGNTAMETVRKGLREKLTIRQKRGLMHDRFVLLKREHDLNDEERLKLDLWTKNYPELGETYRLKEAYYAIYEAESRLDAEDRYREWSRSIPPELRHSWQPVLTAWGNWKPYILAYFDHPLTNAYTESLNSLIRVMNRLGRGYSFEALRAKILFAEGAFKHTNSRPKFERKRKEPIIVTPDRREMDLFSGVPDEISSDLPPSPYKSTQIKKSKKNYGVDISTLVRMLENGEL